jgi:hypothetical protein
MFNARIVTRTIRRPVRRGRVCQSGCGQGATPALTNLTAACGDQSQARTLSYSSRNCAASMELHCRGLPSSLLVRHNVAAKRRWYQRQGFHLHLPAFVGAVCFFLRRYNRHKYVSLDAGCIGGERTKTPNNDNSRSSNSQQPKNLRIHEACSWAGCKEAVGGAFFDLPRSRWLFS